MRDRTSKEDLGLFRGDGSTERIEHLTRLSSEGRIVTLTSSMTDPSIVGKVNDILAAFGEKASVLSFSNVAEYMSDPALLFRLWGDVELRDDARLFTTALIATRSLPTAQACNTATPEDIALVQELGSALAPGNQVARGWPRR